MSTGIEWTEETWNPWMGCTKVSPGCAHCYMFREQRQYGNDPENVRRSKTRFTAPLKWKEGRMIFTCSWSDWFHEGADEWRDEAWDVIRRTPHHTYQILTKRPERILDHLPRDWGAGWPHVWLGVSVENQRWATRAARLLLVPAVVRFVSAEPLLGPVDLRRINVAKLTKPRTQGLHAVNRTVEVDSLGGSTVSELGIEYKMETRIRWVIVGGESGPDPRPMAIEWARALRDQCAATDTAFFLKQLGGWPDKRGREKALLDGARHVALP